MFETFSRVKQLACILVLVSFIWPAHAQELEDSINLDDLFGDDPVLEEIVVTARKRLETLQDIPIAISALGRDELRAAGIANVRDLQQSVPSLRFGEQGSKNPSIFIRGIGQRDANTVLDPGVGVYINGVYIARTGAQSLDTVDTESIQVLRGPQGTLFGKNNTGGAILVTTKAPHTEGIDGFVSARVGNFGRQDSKFSLNLPLNDETLALRFSLSQTKTDGYLKSAYDGKEYGDEDRLAATGRVLWQISNELSADVFAYWSKQNERGAAFTCLFQNSKANIPSFSYPNSNAELRKFEPRCNTSEELADKDEILSNGPSRFTMTHEILALTLAWELENYDIKSITAIGGQDDIVIEDDQDGTDVSGLGNGTYSLHRILADSIASGYSDFGQPGDEERKQFTQEFQLTGSALGERLSYTIGFFYSKEEIDNSVFTQLVGANGYSAWGDVSSILPKLLGTHSDLDNEAKALFVQATYDVTDWFALTAGFRRTEEEREREATIYAANCSATDSRGLVRNANAATCAVGGTLLASSDAIDDFLTSVPPYLPVDRVGVVKDSDDFNENTPSLTASFNLPEEIFEDVFLDSALIYGTYSVGFKAGGFEVRGQEMVKFDEEEVTNRETGVKLEAFEHRLRVNAAYYEMDYEDMQIRIAEQGASLADIFLFISNAGEAKVKGFELEVVALPMDNLTLQLSLSKTDADYDEFITSVVDSTVVPPVESSVDRSAENFPSVPEMSYSASAAYRIDSPFGIFEPRLNVFYRDEIFVGIDHEAVKHKNSTIDDVMLVSLRLAYKYRQEDPLAVTVFVNNLTDEQYFKGGFSQTSAMGAATVVKGSPRAYGLELLYTF